MEKREIWRLVHLLVLGQTVSLSLGVNIFTSSLLANLGVNIPLTQSFFTYLLLSLVYGTILLRRGKILLVPWYWYVGLALVDVQGNFLAVKSLQYASITSVTLLDCWAVPFAMILTWLVLKTKYSLWQFAGAAICVLGLIFVLFSDARVSGGGGGSRPLLGDALVIAGTFCYACSNAGEEFCVKKKDRIEVVAMLGLFGVLVSALEISIFERNSLREVNWSPTIIALIASFAASTFLFYTMVPFVLKMSGSTLFNLSLLTSDMWAVLIRIFFYRQKVDGLYYLALGVSAIGIIIYSLNERASNDQRYDEAYERLSRENQENDDNVVTC